MSISLESLMRASIIGTTRSPIGTGLVSFIIVGGLAALGFVGLSAVMIDLRTGLPDWAVSALCYAIFIVPAYLAHRRISFRSSAPHRIALPRYAAVQLSALALASLFSYVSYGVLLLPGPAASVLVVGLTSGVNFLVLRLWAFAAGR